ncbi:MAG: hypothetical protein ACHQT5_00425 [Candidatus Saccharimonadales bacterium]
MDKLSRRLMSLTTKQRFSEALALLLIVGLVGLLVYLLVPAHTAAPKVAPVTVRSSALFAMQRQAADPISHAPAPRSGIAQAAVVPDSSALHGTVYSNAVNIRSDPHASTSNNQMQASLTDKMGQRTQANVSSSCTNLAKPVTTTFTKVGSVLHLSSLVSGLVADTPSCQS